MRRPLALALPVGLGAAAAAQRVPNEFPTPGEGPAERNERDLTKRFRPFLSHLYVESAVAAGPADPLGEASAAVGVQYTLGLRRLTPEAGPQASPRYRLATPNVWGLATPSVNPAARISRRNASP